MTNDDNQCRKGVGCDEQCRTCARSKANAKGDTITAGEASAMIQDGLNSMAFDITVRNIQEISEGMDDALRYLYTCADNLSESASGGGYKGEYPGVYQAVVDRYDVLAAIEDVGAKR